MERRLFLCTNAFVFYLNPLPTKIVYDTNLIPTPR